jgi:hypothetical protein
MSIEPMAWSVLETGPYAENFSDTFQEEVEGSTVHVFRLPLGPTGSMQLVSLYDLGQYAKWMFENSEESLGLKLGVAIAHVTGADHVVSFVAVTGKKARYEDVPLKEHLSQFPPGKIGARSSPGYDGPTLVTAAEQFGPWRGIWRESGGNRGLWTRDYDLLDKSCRIGSRVKKSG